MTEPLERVLAEAQRIGLIGPGSLEVAVAHAARVAELVPSSVARIVDVGSGGGVPGLVVARERPQAQVLLVERRGRACDFLRRATSALGWSDRVQVIEADAAELARDPAWRARADAVTARGVAPPGDLAEVAVPLLRPGGRLVVTAAGAGARWPDDGVATLGARVLSRDDGLVVLEAGECPDRFPRRRRRPRLF